MDMDTNNTEGEEAVHLLKEWGVGSSGVRPASPDPKAHAIWKQRTMQTEKTCIRDELAKACGFGILLVKHWMSENPPNPAGRDFVTACELCYASEIPGHFLSGTVLEEWYEKDWRGMKGRPPTPILLFERALMVKARLESELETDRYRAPIVRRHIDLDNLPSAVSRHTTDSNL